MSKDVNVVITNRVKHEDLHHQSALDSPSLCGDLNKINATPKK